MTKTNAHIDNWGVESRDKTNADIEHWDVESAEFWEQKGKRIASRNL